MALTKEEILKQKTHLRNKLSIYLSQETDENKIAGLQQAIDKLNTEINAIG